MRPGSGRRLGTGRLGTGRLGTGRLGTGVQPVYTGVGLNTEVNIKDRPVTREGMVGIAPGTMGPGRQVVDASYYVGKLRQKTAELTTEIDKMKAEVEQFHKDSTTYQQYERKYETLIKEVRRLEGQLADYNLAMDKSRTSTDPREIHHYFNSLRARNQHEAKEIDNVFLRRQERDQQTAQVDQQLQQLQHQAAEKMNSLPHDKQQLYHRLLQENGALGEDIRNKQAELERLNADIDEVEQQLRRDPYRDEYARLEKMLTRVEREREQLEEEAAQTSLDPAEARAKLLEKAREDNARLVQLAERLQDVQDTISRRRSTLQDLAQDMEERKGEAGDTKKYEVLYQRDREMTEFIENFEETKTRAQQEQEHAQGQVVALLEHISKGLERQHNMPSKQRVSAMKEDLSFRTRVMESAQTTHQRLLQELAKRNSELEKIETLDSKISVELKSLNEKIRSMNEQMPELSDIDALRAKADHQKALLTATKARYLRRRDLIRQQVRQLSASYERKKSLLADHATAKTLESLEQRLANYEQKIFQLREYINTKGKETEHASLAEECRQLTDDVNAFIIRAQATMVPSLTTAPY